MGVQVIFEIDGHGQLNGHIRIEKSVEMDSDLANRLRTNKTALHEFVRVHYPGVENFENSLSVRINRIKQEAISDAMPKSKSFENNKEGPKKNLLERKAQELELLRIKGVKESEKVKSKIEKQRVRQELVDSRRKIREENLVLLKESYRSKNKDIFYYLRFSWSYLDSPWKKALCIFLVLYIFSSIYNYILSFF